MLTLQFEAEKIPYWASRYCYKEAATATITAEVMPQVRTAGHYTRQNFLSICTWKSPRPQRHCDKNTEAFIHAVTQTALTTDCEQLRIEALTLLKGVSFPMASALLHFGCSDPYPILDVRALWSLGLSKPQQYSFELWWDYTLYCRKLSADVGISIRVLDQALWQYSKEKQGKAE